MHTILLSNLLQGMGNVPSEADLSISGLALDSRSVQSGDLFIAYRGVQSDGRKFISQAIKQGAIAVLAENDANQQDCYFEGDIPVITIPGLHHKVSEMESCF